MKFHIAIYILLIFISIMANADWEKGQNRILNSDFEGDEIGKVPVKWALEKGG
ncbi:MAG: hypothetical protein ACUVWN_03515 [bacterium]